MAASLLAPSTVPVSTAWPSLQDAIVSCQKCPRLIGYCQEIGQLKRRAYQNENYWSKPVPGFGDPLAQVAIIGLAPGAHGANRTGRVFTGDRSGDWLYRALFKAGLSNQAESVQAHDSLQLINAYITCVVKCAPPDNKPQPSEQKICNSYLQQEVELLTHVRVWIALGQVAFQALWPLLKCTSKRPPFRHGGETQLNQHQTLLLSYHPSQQNTFTGRLTEPMFDSVFARARNLL